MKSFYSLFVLFLLMAVASSGLGETSSYRWQGHPFVFVFITDDGTNCNLGWADLAREMDFRFTIAVNQAAVHPNKLTAEAMHELHEDGFEIANHAYGHGHTGVSLDCPIPPRGSLLAYYMCDGFEPGAAMTYFKAEIERDSLAAFVDMPLAAVRTLAYPNHRYNSAVIDSLMAEGYLGARYGENSSFSQFSYGEFTTPARNSWDGGISLFRVPLTHYSAIFFGNHSAVPPVHFSYEEFQAATQPYIDQAIANGGMFVIYSHHFGDDDDSYGDINYSSAGVTVQDLAWMVDLVRQNNGIVMTFGDALEYYRARTGMIEIAGDFVWAPSYSGVVDLPTPDGFELEAAPNPFNAQTGISFQLAESGQVVVEILDMSGRRVRGLWSGVLEQGRHNFQWDGRNETGRPTSSGIYLVVLATGQGRTASRITLLK